MNAIQKKAYDKLTDKVVHIYIGATGKMCKVDELVEMNKGDGSRITMALFSLIEEQHEDSLASEMVSEFNNFDSSIDDIEQVVDWLFEKGVR